MLTRLWTWMFPAASPKAHLIDESQMIHGVCQRIVGCAGNAQFARIMAAEFEQLDRLCKALKEDAQDFAPRGLDARLKAAERKVDRV